MNPTFTSPPAKSIVTCLMADRMAEAADAHLASEALRAEGESESRLVRYIAALAHRESQPVQTTVLAQGR